MNFWNELKLQNRPILLSAPLDGVSDFAFCKICLDGGADVVYTEMTSANDLYHNSKQLITYLKQFKGTHKVGIQLYGKEPDKFTKAAQIAEELGFDEININIGCPAKGVTSSGGGVMLMRDLDNIYKIIENTLKGTKLPVSIKIRAGVDVESILKHQLTIPDNTINFIQNKKHITAFDLLNKIKNLPISCVIIHGRTYEQLFSGEINYDLIKVCKVFIDNNFLESKKINNISPIVIANGGIIDKVTEQKVLNLTNVDGIMIGMGSYGKPFIFNELKGQTNNDLKTYILNHAKYLFESKPQKAHLDFRKHLLWYLKDNENFKALREDIIRIENLEDINKIVDKL